jgi:hypothetical protein
MSKIGLIFFFILTLTAVQAQTPWYMPIEYHQGKKYYFEFIAGGSVSDLSYRGNMYNQLNRAIDFQPILGLAYRVQLPKQFSFAPAFVYENKGVIIADQIQYSLKAHYINLVLPCEFYKLLYPGSRSKTGYFATIGPYIGIPVRGEIEYEELFVPLSKANFKPFDAGIEVGAGFRFSTFSTGGGTNIRIKLSYSHGFIDTYSNLEHKGTAKAINVPTYIIEGQRYNQLLKLTLGFEIPLEKKETITFTAGGDGKSTYKKYVNIYR